MTAGKFAGTLVRALGRILSPRRARREAITARAMPRSWTAFLETHSDHYRRLPVPYRAEFDRQLQVFLAETRITGIQIDVSEPIRILVGASAVTLSAGWPEYSWDRVVEVLVYADYFDRDFRLGGRELAGLAHPWGVVIVSAPALWRSYAEGQDRYHVGYHEFAHLLDRSQTGGIPIGLSDDALRNWMRIMDEEDARLRHGASILDSYALSSPNELFAVAVETFFQRSTELRDQHGALYAFLAEYFQQDPATWQAPRENS